jgi:hypothetical protein
MRMILLANCPPFKLSLQFLLTIYEDCVKQYEMSLPSAYPLTAAMIGFLTKVTLLHQST